MEDAVIMVLSPMVAIAACNNPLRAQLDPALHMEYQSGYI